jgi:NAD(P)-dependent dehydrogenase (short-subunit alcohol dehydrogenase family)
MAEPKLTYEDRVALVMGAVRGIRQSIALRLAEHGARLARVDLAEASKTAGRTSSLRKSISNNLPPLNTRTGPCFAF